MTHKQNKQMIVNAILFLSMLTVSLACNKQNKKIASKPVESIQNPEINMQAKKTPNIEENEINLIDLLDQQNPKQQNPKGVTIAQKDEEIILSDDELNYEEKQKREYNNALNDLITIIKMYFIFNHDEHYSPMKVLHDLLKAISNNNKVLEHVTLRTNMDKAVRRDLHILLNKGITNEEKEIIKEAEQQIVSGESSSDGAHKPPGLEYIREIKGTLMSLDNRYPIKKIIEPITSRLKPTYKHKDEDTDLLLLDETKEEDWGKNKRPSKPINTTNK